jgi:hypothetical protein
MRDIFPGHFKKSSSQIEDIWNDAFFMIDANILLNLYRYSESTKKDFLTILINRKIQKRLWLPYRAAQEYLQNRSTVIAEQSKSYLEMITSIDTFKAKLDNKRQHPFVSDSLKVNVDKVLDELLEELKNSHTKQEYIHDEDKIKTDIDRLFSKQITEKYDDKRLEELFSDGAKRYKEKIPPGYKDRHKANDEDTFASKMRVYGDLIIWNQILDFAKNKQADIIFVTDDKKEDWWNVSSTGKTIGPKPELIEEFENETKQSILIYQADRFFEYSSKYLNQNVNPGSKDEITDLTNRNFRLKNDKERIGYIYKEIMELNLILKQVEAKWVSLKSHRLNLLADLEHLKNYGDESMIENAELKIKEIDFELRNISQQRSDFEAQLSMKQSALALFKEPYSFL